MWLELVYKWRFSKIRKKIKIRNLYFNKGTPSVLYWQLKKLLSIEAPEIQIYNLVIQFRGDYEKDNHCSANVRLFKISLRACGICCHQSKPRTIGCSAAMSGGTTAKVIELVYRLIAEIQGSEGCMVQWLWRTLHIVKIPRRRMENCTRQRLCMEELWLFTSEWSVGLVRTTRININTRIITVIDYNRIIIIQ